VGLDVPGRGRRIDGLLSFSACQALASSGATSVLNLSIKKEPDPVSLKFMTPRMLKPLVLIAVLATVAIVAAVSLPGLFSGPPGTQTQTQTLTHTQTQTQTQTQTVPGTQTQSQTGGACVFPNHNYEYADGELHNLWNNAVVPVESIMPLDLSLYPELAVRQGFRLQRVVFAGQGGDAWAFVVAVCESTGKGFAIEPMNGTQGGFVFGPISSPTIAEEYAEFMCQETQVSFFDREHREVKTDAEFREILEGMQSRAREQNFTLEYGQTPPVNHSTAVAKDDSFLVHRIFFKRLERERLICWLVEVRPDGRIVTVSQFTFVTGVPGAIV